jgi:predicted N-formylglutamate amidohydrolase
MTYQPFRTVNPRGPSSLVFICDHASNRVPDEFGDLGIPGAELQRHIAWDIGAAGVADILARYFDAPVLFSDVSRLVIDCNRAFDDPGLIPAISDGTQIPANQDLTERERRRRWKAYHQPYHDAIEEVIAGKLADRQTPIVVSVHSMTPVMKGFARPWQIAMCSAADRRLNDPVLAALRRRSDITVGDNEPYTLDTAEDYSVPHHAMRRNLQYLQVEFRQDEITTPDGQRRWADIFGACVERALSCPV